MAPRSDWPQPAATTPSATRRTVVLDADGVSKLARRDPVVRSMLEQEVRDADSALVVPIIVVPQSMAGGVTPDDVRTILRAAHEVAPVDFDRASHASNLIQTTALLDVVDALVAVEALRRVPAIVITSDPDDIRQLLDADPAGKRVAVWRV